MQDRRVSTMWAVRAVRHWNAMRAVRMAHEMRLWEYEPTTLRVKIRQAYCILVAHKWLSGINSDPSGESDCVILAQECLRCGIDRYDECLTHSGDEDE